MKLRKVSSILFASVLLYVSGLLLPGQMVHAEPEGVEINEENFPDKNFRDFVKSLPGSWDGVFTDAELADITSMHCDYWSIQDMTGIGYFTALTELRCVGNQLTNLDLSENINLEELCCDHNGKGLTSLNVSNCPALTKLVCDGNQLTSLDVSNCPALTRLDCQFNQLITLNVSKNTELTYLSCGDNSLTSLDVSKNTKLEELYCCHNDLTSLDVSRIPAIKDAVENNTSTRSDLLVCIGEQGTLYADPTVEIITVATDYTVTVSTDGNGIASADPEFGIEGTNVTLTATPNEGYQFKEWQVDPNDILINEDNQFTIGTRDVKVTAIFEKHEHDWGEPTYNWSEDNSLVTAKRICNTDGSHVETETVATTSEVTEASCEEKGTTTYKATFTKEDFKEQTKTVENINAVGHDWGEPTYDWSEDNSQVTAARICKKDVNHVETETVDTISDIITAVTCEENGTTTYTTKAFENAVFTEQTKTVDIEATGHDWGEPSYDWSEDNSQVTATRICKKDVNHVETETVGTTSEIITAASCEEKGTTTYTTKAFENAVFTEQTKTVDIEAAGHDWGEPSYDWSEDNSQVTATRICKTDGSHVETETVDTTSEVIEATCVEKGEATYKATFTKEGFAKLIKIVDIEATGHDWGDWIVTIDPTETAEGEKTRTCTNNSSHTETQTIEKIVIPSYEVTVNSNLGGSASVSAETVKEGTTVTITAVPNDGFEIDQITYTPAGGSETDITSTKSFTMPAAKVIVNVKFKEKVVITPEPVIYTVAVSDDGNGTALADPASGETGTEVTLIVTPNNGYQFKEWEFVSGDVTVADIKDNKFNIGNENVVVKAIFEEIPKTPGEENPGNPGTPDSTPNPGSQDSSAEDPTKPGASVETVEKFITGLTTDNDPAGSVYQTLQARASKVTKSSIKLSWKKISGAKSYIIYGNKCGRKNKYQKITTVTKTSYTLKKLKKGTYYKYLVVAYDKDNKAITTSKTIHAATTGGKYGNAKSVTTKAKKNKVTIKAKKSFNLKAKAVINNKKLKMQKHRSIQYESTDTKIATVNKKGVIKGKAKGTCYVYVYAMNGVSKKIKVTVK